VFEYLLGLDDGTIFSFDINFLDEIFELGDTVIYSYITSVDTSINTSDIYWTGENVLLNNGNTTVQPQTTGDFFYTLNVIDNFGCIHDTTVIVTVSGPDANPHCSNYCSSEVFTNILGVVSDGSGDFQSLNNVDCEWLIAPDVEEDRIILISFNEFDSEPDDVLRIYDGNNSDASLIGLYYGHTLPDDILTTGNTAYLHYLADDSIRSDGCLLYTSPSPRDVEESRMPSSA